VVVDEDGGTLVRNVLESGSLVSVEDAAVPDPVPGNIVSGLGKGQWVRLEGHGRVDEGLQDQVEVAGNDQHQEEDWPEKGQATKDRFKKAVENVEIVEKVEKVEKIGRLFVILIWLVDFIGRRRS